MLWPDCSHSVSHWSICSLSYRIWLCFFFAKVPPMAKVGNTGFVGCLHRTILELKLCWMYQSGLTYLLIIAPYWNWNVVNFKNGSGNGTYNRTILELKLCYVITYQTFVCLIIAPYWNWNSLIASVAGLTAGSYNRTILELKQCVAVAVHIPHMFLIIAPYWNWNI